MVNHAKKGLAYELDFISYNNNNKSLSNPIWNFLISDLNLNISINNLYLIKTSNAYSKLHKCLINSKSDTYIGVGSIPFDILKNLNFIIDEDTAKNYNLKKLEFSGISIKKPDSKNYQILKISPTPFFNLFENYDIDPLSLGAGASLYCKKESELSKNFPLIRGWGSNLNSFKIYFNHIDNISLIDDPNTSDEIKLKIFKSIKNFSTSKIKNIIVKNQSLLDAIFLGKGIFEEPYVAHYIFENNIINKNITKDFKITTGSGRSKGIYQLEFKP